MTPIFALLMAATAASTPTFDDSFADRTLRIDYQLCGDKSAQHIFLAGMKTDSVWAGRRHRLNELPLEGRGQLIMTSAETGDTLYSTSFCSLFNEWLDTDEAASTSKAFEHTVLVPMPKKAVNITVTLTDPYRKPMTMLSHTVNPNDILIDRTTSVIPPYRYLHQGNTPDKAIDVAILAEGYSHDQIDLFYADALTAVESILSHQPFADNKDNFNFVAVASTTANTDVSHPKDGQWTDSAFGSHFSTFYSDRYLTTPHVFAVNDALRGIPYEHIIILANTPEYGGGGIYNSYTLTTSRHDAFRPVVTHEFGHSFGGLADEYFHDNEVYTNEYPLDVEPWERNVTTLADFNGKWEDLIEADTPIPTLISEEGTNPTGVYEGGAYVSKGVYRSTPDCRMKTNTATHFCPACQLALTRLIEFYTR